MGRLRWGIIGLGHIANKFASTIMKMPDMELTAIASRDKQKADDFGINFHINTSKCYDDYQQLLMDTQVDAVYISTPNSLHYKLSLESLRSGKATLCEKPVTVSGEEIDDVIEMANKQHVFFMEAMKFRFLPAVQEAKRIVESGQIGQLQFITADFGFKAPFDPNHRLYNLQLGGGSLLDVGVYALSLATMFLGNTPMSMDCHKKIGESNVDESIAMSLKYDDGVIAQLYGAINVCTNRDAVLVGTNGRIVIKVFSNSQCLHVISEDINEEIHFPFEINGFEYQIKEVARCLKKGGIESSVMPHEDSKAVMHLVDWFQTH